MKIINQSTYNECGICAINMIINYYYHDDRDRKIEIYKKTKNMDKDGLSIFEIESILKTYNIECCSYECSYDEIFSINDSFILILNNGGKYHYVVGKVKNNNLHIYDPIGKKIKLTINDNLTNFSGYIICTKFSRKKIKPINFHDNVFKNLPISLNIIFIFINIFEFLFSIFCSYLLSKYLALDLSLTYLDTIWKISFIYVLVLLISEFFNWLNNYIKKYYFTKIMPTTLDEFWKKINSKTFKFFKSYSEHELVQIYSYILRLIRFNCYFCSDLISEIIVIFFTVAIGMVLNMNFLFLFIILLLVNFILTCIQIRINKTSIKFNHKENPYNEQELLNYFKEKQKMIYKSIQDNQAKKIQMNINKVILKNIEIDNHFSLLALVDKILNGIIQYVIIILFLINKNHYGMIFLYINVLNLFSQSLKTILNFIKEYNGNILIIEYIRKIYAVNSQNSTQSLMKKIYSISIGNKEYLKNLCINKKSIYDNVIINKLTNMYDPENLIKINGNCLNINDFDFYCNYLIYINFPLNPILFLNQASMLPNNVIDYIANKDEDYNNELSIMIYLLQLMNEKNKIIIIDYSFQDVIDDFFLNEIKKILTTINKDNYLISNNLNPKLYDIYDNFI